MTEVAPRRRYTLKARDFTLTLGERTLIMGILNVTPDSFSDRGQYFETQTAVDRAWDIVREGADILDIGGESTRPGSSGVSVDEELKRVIPVIETLRSGKYPLPISVDTSKPEVARVALATGASIINDITSLKNNTSLGEETAEAGAALVLMHMRGEPRNMQTIPPSLNILDEIDVWAEEAVARARKCGVSSDKIVLDPGIGFGKTAAQNFELIANLNRLVEAGFPVLIGTSRKSFIGSVLKKPAGERVLGTCATVVASILFGAHIVRVHDVVAVREAADVTDALLGTLLHAPVAQPGA
ncbi:MAG: dihydropteroate synthase [Acidobacteria bacterium]|nr:dihydropteroate synthase [Acidobacteriota bacterium]